MKFDYQNYPTEQHYGLRWYVTPDGPFPSITTVLGVSETEEKKASLQNWRNSLGAEKADKVTRDAASHGTMVHTLCERFLKGEDVSAPVNGAPVPGPDLAAFNSIKLKLKSISEVWGQEQSVYSPTLEVAGRFDCVGVYKKKESVLDFKTAMRLKTRKEIESYELQLAFYAAAHNETFGTDIQQGVVIMAGAGGMPMEFIINIDSKLEPLCARIETFWTKTLANIK